jgi:hypothetical protein
LKRLVPDKRAKQKIKELNKKIRALERAYQRIEIGPCKGRPSDHTDRS